MRRVWRRDEVTIHRPWLSVWRAEILGYAQRQQLNWCEDPSNQETQHRRNYLRQELIPILEKKFGPQLGQRLWRTAEIGRDQSIWVQQLVEVEARAEKLAVPTLRQYTIGHQRALLFSWLEVHGINDISFSDIEAARGLLEADRPAQINLSQGRFLRRKKGYLILQ
jgi:tRNA(Ile)-lysidine synthase